MARRSWRRCTGSATSGVDLFCAPKSVAQVCMSEFVLARNGVEGLCFLAMRCGIQAEGLNLRSPLSSEVRFARAISSAVQSMARRPQSTGPSGCGHQVDSLSASRRHNGKLVWSAGTSHHSLRNDQILAQLHQPPHSRDSSRSRPAVLRQQAPPSGLQAQGETGTVTGPQVCHHKGCSIVTFPP